MNPSRLIVRGCIPQWGRNASGRRRRTEQTLQGWPLKLRFAKKLARPAFLAAFVALGGVAAAKGLEFQAVGRISHVFHGSGLPKTQVKPYEKYSDFGVFVRDCRWLICSTNSEQNQIDYYEAGQIENDGVLVLVFESSASQAQARQGRFAKVSGLPFPRFTEADKIPLLWFAYSSTCYLDSLGGRESELETINSFGASGIDGHLSRKADATLQRYSESPKLPSSTVWFNKASGNTNAVFVCLSTVKINNLVLPDAWTYQVYTQRQGEELRLLHSYRVEHTTYSADCSLRDLTPRLSSIGLETMVTDYRFAERNTKPVPRVTYTVTNKWLSRVELEKRSLFGAAVQIALHEAIGSQREKGTSRVKKGVILSIGCLLLLAPLLFAAKTHKHKQRLTQKG